MFGLCEPAVGNKDRGGCLSGEVADCGVGFGGALDGSV